jgi:Patatin-like phospholipase
MKTKVTHFFPTIATGAILLSASGCVTSRNTQKVADESFLITNATALRQVVGDQMETKDGQAQKILVLSGGAAHGAFGAGVLNGWHRTGEVPKWDVVTGISTGALLATCAFLGTDEDYGLLYTNYTQVKTSDIIRPKWLGIKPLAAIFASSLYSSTPLKHRIGHQITDDKIKQVAKAAAEGQSLFVGTVDLASGNFYIWDMTKLAQEADRTGSRALFDKYREILRASASIPGYFPPRTYNETITCGRRHSRTTVLPRQFPQDLGGNQARLQASARHAARQDERAALRDCV